MPEGDTVYAAAARLHRSLGGLTLLRSDFRVPAHATADLSGRRLLNVVPRGKHLLMRVEGGTTVHSHLKMEGEWQTGPRGGRPRGPAHEVRVVLETQSTSAYGIRLGILELLATADEEKVVGHLGPDLLAPTSAVGAEDEEGAPPRYWDAQEALRRLVADPVRTIGEALLDQRVMAGIGNVYRSELCFVRGIEPTLPVGAVPEPAEVVRLARRMLWANRDTARHITTGDARPGREHWVYGRRNQPCRRCGTPVRRDELDGRVVYWCPHCQR